MESCESPADDTPEDLRSISFDEWDKNFIASFEENMFNLFDDDGKNLGFILSPKGKGNPLLFSPDGKRMTPGAFRKTLGATSSPLMKYTPVVGTTLHGFSDEHTAESSNRQFTELDSQNVLHMTPVASTQPKKQLFPCEKSVHVSDPAVQELLFNSNYSSGIDEHLSWSDSSGIDQCPSWSGSSGIDQCPSWSGSSGIDQCPSWSGSSGIDQCLSWVDRTTHPSQHRLHAARTRFSHVLRNAVEITAEKVKELRASGEMEDTDVMVNHPELRQALGTYSKRNLDSETNIQAGSVVRSVKRPFMSKSSVSTLMKPDSRQSNRRVTKYSRIQPKKTVSQGFTMARF